MRTIMTHLPGRTGVQIPHRDIAFPFEAAGG
jgi:hypothetical protein